MCGIAGAIGRVDRSVLDALERMDLSQAHRGPDASGTWTSPEGTSARVALAHRRLAILDLSEDAGQPMIDPDTGTVVVYNGEIYNFRELRRELEGEGVRFRTRCDTEVLLAGWIRWGTACLERLRGMFAFAIYDPARREVVLARDPMGIKPLYFCEHVHADGGTTLLFSSELRALLASELVERRLDPTGLASFLWHGFVPGPTTILRGVSLLDAGTVRTVSLDGSTRHERRFWQLPDEKPGTTDPEQLQSALADAVGLRLASDVPLGIFLSGGVDSSAIASLASRAGEDQIHTFNIAFEEAEFDESHHAREVAARLGTQHTEIRLSGSTFQEGLDDSLNSLDQPTFDGINTYFVSRAVREAGITVALAGTGGDELFGGYSSFTKVPRAARWARGLAWLPRGVRRAAGRAAGRLLAGKPGEVLPQTQWGKLSDALAASGTILDAYQLSYGLFTQDFLDELINSEHVPRLELGLERGRADELAALVQGAGELHAVSSLELATFIRERLLRDTDCASMAVSLEVRVPLLDTEVVRLTAGVATADRFEPLGSKALLRRLALDTLPADLFDRPKAGFVLPLERWCRESLGEEVAQVLSDRELCDRVGLNPAAVLRLWRSFLDDAPGIYWSRVWSLYVLMRWCAAHDVRL